MTLKLKPEIAVALQALAASKGLSVQDYLLQLVEIHLTLEPQEKPDADGSGMVWEDGLFVYRTGRPLPQDMVDDAIRRSREERAQRILGNLS